MKKSHTKRWGEGLEKSWHISKYIQVFISVNADSVVKPLMRMALDMFVDLPAVNHA